MNMRVLTVPFRCHFLGEAANCPSHPPSLSAMHYLGVRNAIVAEISTHTAKGSFPVGVLEGMHRTPVKLETDSFLFVTIAFPGSKGARDNNAQQTNTTK